MKIAELLHRHHLAPTPSCSSCGTICVLAQITNDRERRRHPLPVIWVCSSPYPCPQSRSFLCGSYLFRSRLRSRHSLLAPLDIHIRLCTNSISAETPKTPRRSSGSFGTKRSSVGSIISDNASIITCNTTSTHLLCFAERLPFSGMRRVCARNKSIIAAIRALSIARNGLSAAFNPRRSSV